MTGIRRLAADKRGELMASVLGGALALILISGLIGAYLNAHTVIESAETYLTQAATVAIDSAMLDSARIDGDGQVDTARAKDVFGDYLRDYMGLSSGVKRSPSGQVVYRLEDIVVTVQSSPPAMDVTCTLYLPGLFNFLPEVSLKLHIHANNRRIY